MNPEDCARYFDDWLNDMGVLLSWVKSNELIKVLWWLGSHSVCVSWRRPRTWVTQHTFLPIVSHYSTSCGWWWISAKKSWASNLLTREEEDDKLQQTWMLTMQLSNTLVLQRYYEEGCIEQIIWTQKYKLCFLVRNTEYRQHLFISLSLTLAFKCHAKYYVWRY